MTRYHVWPDGWVEDIDYEPPQWRSDDFMLIEAEDEEAPLAEFERRERTAWGVVIQQT